LTVDAGFLVARRTSNSCPCTSGLGPRVANVLVGCYFLMWRSISCLLANVTRRFRPRQYSHSNRFPGKFF
jgi:hypothetical protein